MVRLGRRTTAQEVEEYFYSEKGSADGDGQDIAGANEQEGVPSGGIARPGGKTVIEDSQGATDGSDNRSDGRSDGQSEADMEAEEDVESTPSTTKSRKRTSDLFEEAHPVNSEERSEAEDPARRPAKRSRGSRKAKPPLYSPKTSQPATARRQTRATAREVSREPETERIPRSTSRTAAGNKSRTPQKRPRGRPRKHKVSEKSSDPSEHLPEQPIDDAGAIEDDEEDPDAPEHGVSGILLNPSPVKPLLSAAQRPNSNQRISKSHTHPVNGAPPAQSLGLPSISDAEENDEDEEEEETAPNVIVPNESGPEIPEDDGGQVFELPTTLKDVISVEQLEELLETVQRVGQTQDKATKEWKVVKTEAHPYSAPGKRMMRRLKVLIKSYSALPVLKAAGGHAVKVNQDNAAKVVGELLEEAETVFNERLPSKAQGVSRQQNASIYTMLNDVYFFLVPNLVGALKLAVEAYQDEGLSETDSMKQVMDLLVLLRKLGDRALQQPKGVQLKEKGYRTSKPTSSVIPTIRHLSRNLQIELRRREQIRKTEARNADASDRERKWAAEAERESEEKRRRGNEIKREQQRLFNARRNDPHIGRYLQKTEAKRAEAQTARSSRSRPYRSSQIFRHQDFDDDDDEMNIQDDPFADQDEPRSRMTPLLIRTNGNPLGTNNASNYRSPSPLSREEKTIFINTMIFGDSMSPCLNLQLEPKLTS